MDYIVLIVKNMYLQNLIEIVVLFSLLIQVSTHPQIQGKSDLFVIYTFIYSGERERERERERDQICLSSIEVN